MWISTTSSPLTTPDPSHSLHLFYGSSVKIKIEPGTQPGKTLRLRGKGLPAVQGYGNGTGDLIIQVSVFIPKTLNKGERKAMESFRESENFTGDNHTKRSIFEHFKKLFG